jgi:NitT/TauT family transport system permease protein
VEYLWRIVFPASLPHIFSGMNVGIVFSFIMLTVAELFGAGSGLGRFVQINADYADYPRMVAGILYTGAVVLVTMELLEQLKRRTLFWVK